MKADKKKAKAEADETKPKSKSASKGKDKRKASDAPSGKKKAKKSTPDTELKLLPEPKAKASGKVRATSQESVRAKPAAKSALATAKAEGTQQGAARVSPSRTASRGSPATSAKPTAAGGAAQSAQRKVAATQGAGKASARVASGAQQGERRVPKSTPKTAQGQTEHTVATEDSEDESEAFKESRVRAGDKSRLRVKSASAAKARQAYAERDEDDEWEDEAQDSEDEEAQEAGDVKERGLVQFRRTDEADSPAKADPKVKKSTLIIGAACVAVLFVGFCMMNFAPKKGGPPGGPGGPGFGGEATEVTVRSTTAQVATLHDYVETNGEIECESSVECYPDIGGKIAKVFVALGDRVWKGTALAEVDPNEPGTYFINSVVYAPISGMVTATPKEVGTTVTTTTSITTIGNVSRLQIRAKVPERYVAFLKVGLKADIILEAYPDETFTATVRKVSPVVDADSRTKEILLRFDQSDPRINAGMFAKLTLFTADYEGEIVVPSNAIVEKTGGKQNVFVLAPGGGSVSLREVETGKSVDTMVQIISGLNEGERVITEGMTSLSDGAAVRDITAGLQQSTSFAQAPTGTAAGTPATGAPGAGGPPPDGARGAAR